MVEIRGCHGQIRVDFYVCTIWMHINRFKVTGLCYKFCRTSPTKTASFTGLIFPTLMSIDTRRIRLNLKGLGHAILGNFV